MKRKVGLWIFFNSLLIIRFIFISIDISILTEIWLSLNSNAFFFHALLCFDIKGFVLLNLIP